MLGDDIVATTAMIDRLVHRAEVLSLPGDRFEDRDFGRVPGAENNNRPSAEE
jgi:hypothetical protein